MFGRDAQSKFPLPASPDTLLHFNLRNLRNLRIKKLFKPTFNQSEIFAASNLRAWSGLMFFRLA